MPSTLELLHKRLCGEPQPNDTVIDDADDLQVRDTGFPLMISVDRSVQPPVVTIVPEYREVSPGADMPTLRTNGRLLEVMMPDQTWLELDGASTQSAVITLCRLISTF